MKNVGVFPFILDGQTLEIIGEDVELKNGSYSFLSTDIEIMKGRYEEGQKIGEWDYLIGDKNLKLDWSVFTENSGRFSFSYPSAWNLPTAHCEIDLLIKTDKSDNNLQLILYEHELDSLLELQSYFEQYLLTLNNNYGNLDVEAYKITETSTEFYYLKSRISGKKNYFIHALMYRSGNNIYDFTYISKEKDYKIWEVVFFDFLYSLDIDGKSLMDVKSEYFVQPVNINDNITSLF